MADAQRRAVENNRRRLRERGLDRFEVRGLESDKALLRAVARRLARNDAAGARLRAEIMAQVSPAQDQRGGVLRALRQSPLVGADLNLDRETTAGRDVDL